MNPSLKLTLSLTIGAALTPFLCNAQIASPGDLDPSGRVYTEIVARVGEGGTMSPPIAGLTLYVVSEDGRRVTLRTNRIGVAGTWLGRARYRFVTPEPYQFDGKLYTWDTVAAVRAGDGLIRLKLANARTSSAVPVVVWKPAEPGSGQAHKEGRTFKTLTRDGVAIKASVSRSRDLLWADIIISNESKRNIDVDPPTFALLDLAPNQQSLKYRPPTGPLLSRALTAATLAPGQTMIGSVFFERGKNAREIMLRVPLSGITFELPFELK